MIAIFQSITTKCGRVLPLVVLTYLLTACGAGFNVSDEEYMQRAHASLEHGDTRTGVIQLKNALRKNPKNLSARLTLANVYVDVGDGAAAEKELRYAITLGATTSVVFEPLAHALLLQRSYEKVLSETIPWSGASAAQLARVASLRGDAYLGLSNYDAAKKQFEQALELDKGARPARLGLAQLAMAEGKLAIAEQYITDILRVSPQDVEALIKAGELHFARGRLTAALSSLTQARTIAPNNVLVHLNLARVYIAQQQWAKALTHITAVRKTYPEDAAATYLRAVVAFNQKQFGQADDLLGKLAKRYPSNKNVLLLAAAASYQLGDYEQARGKLNNFLALSPDYLPAKKLLARVAIKLNDVEQAHKMLQQVLKAAPKDVELLALLVDTTRLQKDFNAASGYLQQLVEIAPGNRAWQFQLANNLLQAGKSEQGIAELRRLIKAHDDFTQAKYLLAAALIGNQSYAEALILGRQLAASQPKLAAPYNLIGTAYLGLKDSANARRAYTQALKLQPADNATAMNLAYLDQQEGNSKAAQQRYQAIVKRTPAYTPALVRLADLAHKAGAVGRQVQWLERARKSNPSEIPARLLLVTHYLNQRDAGNALSVAREAYKAQPARPDTIEALGLALLASGDITAAQTQFNALASMMPDNPRVLFRLAMVALHRSAFADARKLLNRSLTLKEIYAPALAALTALDLRDGDADAALQHARELQAREKHWYTGFALEGDAWYAKKDYTRAALAYEEAYQRLKNAALAVKIYHARQQSGAGEAAFKPLLNWLADHPDDRKMRLLLAEAYAKAGNHQAAITHYEKILQNHPDDITALNNAALIYLSSNRQKAIDYAQKAYRLAPDNIAVLDTYGWLLFKTGEVKRGAQLLERATRLGPAIAEIQYHYAMALMTQGEREQARRIFEQVVQYKRDFPDKSNAQELLRELQS